MRQKKVYPVRLSIAIKPRPPKAPLDHPWNRGFPNHSKLVALKAEHDRKMYG